jgi:hypothetical protein
MDGWESQGRSNGACSRRRKGLIDGSFGGKQGQQRQQTAVVLHDYQKVSLETYTCLVTRPRRTRREEYMQVSHQRESVTPRSRAVQIVTRSLAIEAWSTEGDVATNT